MSPRLLAMALFVGAISLVVCANLAAAPKSSAISSKVKKQKQIQTKIKVIQHKIEVKEHEKKTVIGQLNVTEAKLETAQESLTRNKIKLLDAEADLAATIERLKRTRKQLARRRSLLSRRVADIYEGEDLNFINVILGSSDMWTLLTRTYYLQRILDSDTELIAQIRSDEESIERDRARQTKRIGEIQTLQVRLLGERDQVADLAENKRTQLSKIENSKDLMQQALDQLERESNQIEAEIRRIQNTPVGRKWQARAFRGGLTMPVSGRISSRFGYRVHPITGVYKLHTGVDISCKSGTPIHAAADGVVILARYYGAYGYAVVINHGGGVSTLYGHNSRLLVNVGQEVKRGEVIAKAGSTGYSTGPHCHFERRENGKPVNPL